MFIEKFNNGQMYILMIEFVNGRVKTTSYRSSTDMPVNVRNKYIAYRLVRRIVAERDARHARPRTR